VQFDSQYDTLDLSSFSECTTIAANAFSCQSGTARYSINLQFFGTTAPYASMDVNFDNNGNRIARDTTLDGPIKYLFLPDSITAVGTATFRFDYSFNS
jgi:hypothetical protein